MRLIFVSNMLNHHQVMLCNEFNRLFEHFIFVVCGREDSIGYVKAQEAEYVLRYYLPEEKTKVEQEILEADIVIFGACPNKLIALRMQSNRMAFLYSERFFKKGTWRRFLPGTRKKVYERIVQYKSKNIYVLCASAYLSHDLKILGFPLTKCYKWGYFPEVREQDIEKLFQRKNSKRISILWVGRLIKLKHPEFAIYTAERLRKGGYDFEMTMIGEGIMEKHLKHMVTDKRLENCVYFTGALLPEEVRAYMEAADIFLFTSDCREGWGAVLNESMNSGCAVVASHAAGAVPFLIKDKENGLIYASGNLDEFVQKVILLVENDALREDLARNAYRSMSGLWNAKTAAERLRSLIYILSDQGDVSGICREGPCSLAEELTEHWYR